MNFFPVSYLIMLIIMFIQVVKTPKEMLFVFKDNVDDLFVLQHRTTKLLRLKF